MMLHLRPLPPGTPDPADDDSVKTAWRAGRLVARADVVALFRSIQPVRVATPTGFRLVAKRRGARGAAPAGDRG